MAETLGWISRVKGDYANASYEIQSAASIIQLPVLELYCYHELVTTFDSGYVEFADFSFQKILSDADLQSHGV